MYICEKIIWICCLAFAQVANRNLKWKAWDATIVRPKFPVCTIYRHWHVFRPMTNNLSCNSWNAAEASRIWPNTWIWVIQRCEICWTILSTDWRMKKPNQNNYIMEKKVFRSRVSVLLLLFITAAIGFPMISIIRSGNILNPATYTLVGVLAFCFALFFGMSYTIKNGLLLIKTIGFTTAKAEISKIISIERSYNLLSSPAASLKRIKICFKKGYKLPYWLISPVREQDFLEALKEINPDIYIRVINKEAGWRFWNWDI